jgi:hypothetical protein
MNIIAKILGLIFVLFSSYGKANAAARISLNYCSETGDIKGTVNDEYNKPMAYANVRVIGTGNGSSTAEDGSFTIHAINPGTYDVQASYLGKNTAVIKGVEIGSNQTTYLNFKLVSPEQHGVVIEAYSTYVKPIVSPVYTSMITISATLAGELEHGNTVGMITDVCSSCSETPDHQLVMRGARTGTVEYVVDGERMFGTAQVPSQAIQQVSVLMGGIPAEYGDFTGGVIIISTKDYVSGIRESKMMRKAVLENKQE